MTWIDNNGDVRPQSWEEYLSMLDRVPVWALSEKAYQPLHLPRRERDSEREKVSKMRLRLYRADPHCFWCGRLTDLNLKHAAPELTTVDHLYSRLHPQRTERHRRQEGVLHVLACYECNHHRSVCEQKGRPFIPKLTARLPYAQRADATLISSREVLDVEPERIPVTAIRHLTSIPTLKEEFLEQCGRVLSCSKIQTLKEAIEFARENPAR